LQDQPYDIIPEATAHVLGHETLHKAATEADEAGDAWSAACRWYCYTMLRTLEVGRTDALTAHAKRCIELLDTMRGTNGNASESDRLEMDALRYVSKSMDQEYMTTASARIDRLVASTTGKQDPLDSALLIMVRDCIPAFFKGDARGCGIAYNSFIEYLVTNGSISPDPATSEKSIVVAAGFCGWFHDVMLVGAGSDFDYEKTYGQGGSLLRRAAEVFTYAKFHRELLLYTNNDFYTSSAAGAVPLFLHWGDVTSTNQILDQVCRVKKFTIWMPVWLLCTLPCTWIVFTYFPLFGLGLIGGRGLL
jgi:hypothetical protein